MAGPFGNPNSAAELSVQAPAPQAALPQLNAPEKPSAIAEVAGIVNAVAPSINQAMGDYYQNQMKGELKSVEMALRAAKDPIDRDLLLANEASKDPVVRGALDELKSMGLAVRKGRLSTDYALDRMEQIVANATAKVPAYEKELTSAARSYLGFDPHAAKINDLMQPNPQDTAMNAVRSEAAKLGVSVETMQQINLQNMMLAMEQQKLSIANAQHTANRSAIEDYQTDTKFTQGQQDRVQAQRDLYNKTTGQLVTRGAQLGSGEIYSKYSPMIKAASTNGNGIQNVDEIKSQINDDYSALYEKLYKEAPPGVDIDSAVNSIREEQKGLIAIVDGVSTNKIAARDVDTLTNIYKRRLLSMNKVGALFAVAGPNNTAAIMGMLARANQNQGAMQTWLASGDPNAAMYSLGIQLSNGELVKDEDFVGGWKYVVDGTKPTSEGARKQGVLACMEKLSSPDTTPQEAVQTVSRMSDIVKDPTEFYVAMSSDKMVASNLTHKEVWAQIIQQQATGAVALQRRVASLVQQGVLDPSSIRVDDKGIFRFKAVPYKPLTEAEAQLVRVPDPDEGRAPSTGILDTLGRAGDYLSTAATGAGIILKESAKSVVMPAAVGLSRNITVSNLESDINQFLYFSDKYAKVGIVPKGQYTDRAAFVTALSQAMSSVKSEKQVEGATPSTPIKFQMVDGKLVRVAQ